MNQKLYILQYILLNNIRIYFILPNLNEIAILVTWFQKTKTYNLIFHLTNKS